jgi:hypothetical protein
MAGDRVGDTSGQLELGRCGCGHRQPDEGIRCLALSITEEKAVEALSLYFAGDTLRSIASVTAASPDLYSTGSWAGHIGTSAIETET